MYIEKKKISIVEYHSDNELTITSMSLSSLSIIRITESAMCLAEIEVNNCIHFLNIFNFKIWIWALFYLFKHRFYISFYSVSTSVECILNSNSLII